LPGLFYLKNGGKFSIGQLFPPVVVGGIGGCYGYASYNKEAKRIKERKQRHFLKEEIDTLIASSTFLDILMTHDAPKGLEFHNSFGSYVTDTNGLEDVVRALSPKIWLFGHHHQHILLKNDKTTILGLSILGSHGSIVALEVLEKEIKILKIK
jgi:Icc-related predicted phosphoesterase